jgi:RimJ/RimL family protein N-acetyltransferase
VATVAHTTNKGTLREALLWGGEFLDATIMSILAHEWARRD